MWYTSKSKWALLTVLLSFNVWADSFDPSTLSPTLWLKADAGVTSSGGLVSAWQSQATGSYTFTQSTDANKPIVTRSDNLENLANYSSPANSGQTALTSAGLTFDSVSAADWNVPGLTTTAIAFPDNASTRVVYQNDTTISGLTYDYSFYVRMGDASAPVTGGSNDFSIVAGGNPYAATQTEDLGSGLYRVHKTLAGTGAANNWGVIKYNTQNAKAFKIQGLQLKAVSADHTFLATTGVKQYRGINGLPAVRFDGAASTMSSTATLANIFANNAKTIVAVIDSPLASVGGNQYFFADSASKFVLYRLSSSGYLRLYNDDGAADNTQQTLSANTTTIVQARHDTGKIYLSLNGSAETNADSGNTSSLTGTLTLAGASSYWNGKMMEIIAFNTALSSTNLSLLYNYLQNKWVVPPGIIGGSVGRLASLTTKQQYAYSLSQGFKQF